MLRPYRTSKADRSWLGEAKALHVITSGYVDMERFQHGALAWEYRNKVESQGVSSSWIHLAYFCVLLGYDLELASLAEKQLRLVK